MGHQEGVGTVHQLVDQGQGGGDVRVRVVADEVADPAEGDDLLDLPQGAGEGQAGAGIEQDRLVPLFQQIDVGLEVVVIEDLTDPPDPRSDLQGVVGVRAL